MNRLIPLTSALVLALGVSSVALAQKDNGNGKGGGKENRGQQDRGDNGGRGNEGRGGGNRGERGSDRDDRPAQVRVPDRAREVTRRQDRDVVRDVRQVDRRDAARDVVVFRRDRDRGLVNGCPPGLAKKNNGCLPPGQARKIDRDDYARYNYLWRTRGGNDDYRYRDGYLYRVNRQGVLVGYLPVLGGVLSPGNAWPRLYVFQPAPRYYSQYYGLNDRYQYRYADGVLYGVDPRTQGIGQVAALLTGQQFNVGQRMPAGYDVYNVPYDYRDRYADSPERLYRYNDGYVYQVDPTTQLVQAVIQLLT